MATGKKKKKLENAFDGKCLTEGDLAKKDENGFPIHSQ
jgi:hypothetical protein